MLKLITLTILMAVPYICGSHGDFLIIDMENNTKTLTVKEVKFTLAKPTAVQIDSMFNLMNIPFNKIDIENWEGYEYHPNVQFRIAYSPSEIYLQYLVTEETIKAVYEEDEGSAPYKDSCVEFFSIPGEEEVYYNLEMNCIGKGTFAGGAKRTERTKFGKDVLSKIRRYSTLATKAFGIKTAAENNGAPYTWQLTVAIPLEVFSLSEVKPLKGRTIKANFYKCGDDMPKKQYLTWNKIGTPRPNFHTPEYFGNLYFE
ncbi:MAG: carbohydrate-binding family 9-like protein [Bacteroidales bacterium]